MFKHVGLLTGGTAGIAFLLHYLVGLVVRCGTFFVLNLPFYAIAWRFLGTGVHRSGPWGRWRWCRC